VKVWVIDEKRCVKTFSGYACAVRSVACSPDSSCIASGSWREVKVFNMHTSDVFRTILTNHWVKSVRFLDQHTLMYATEQSTFVIHALPERTNTPRPKLKNRLNRFFREAQFSFEFLQSQKRRTKTGSTKDSNVLMFKYQGLTTAISSDGTRIASTSGGAVKIWQTDGPSPNHGMANHHDHVYSVAFSEDGQLVASGSADNTAKLWDPTTGRCLHTFSHPDSITSVIFSQDSTLLASGSLDQKIRIWDTRTHNLILTFETPEPDIHYVHISLVFSPNGNRLVSLRHPFNWGDGSPKRVDLWEIATGKCFASMEVDEFDKVAFGGDGTSVILENSSETESERWSISPNQSTTDDDKDDHLSLPMKFVPLHDAQQSIPTRFYHYRRGRGWIVDEQERQVLWVPPDMENTGDSCGNRVVLGSPSGRVPIVDLAEVL
jgi:WD40 repeat protein